jgi:hypothetical protein
MRRPPAEGVCRSPLNQWGSLIFFDMGDFIENQQCSPPISKVVS